MIKVITIYPATIGVSSEYSEDWLNFIKILGWKEGDRIWQCAYVISVVVDN